MSVYVVDSGRRVVTPLRVDPKIRTVEELDSVTAMHPIGVADAGPHTELYYNQLEPGDTSEQDTAASSPRTERRHQPRISAIMSSPVLLLQSDWSIQHALTFMDQHSIKHGPVTKDEEIIGLLAENDLLKASLTLDDSTTVETICTPYLVIEGSNPVATACMAMLHQNTNAAIVRNGAGQMIGILTTSDILKSLADLELEVWA
ncbi:CBS domain-containing protein [Hahella ganghwensis]|uniref:CBS domain-containing protein n=1 Tax=Hahella ganghwensis TaxID=286420 RepID=UPI0003829157|nr:CBS domain-containing protein [Hahella ganghwensis]